MKDTLTKISGISAVIFTVATLFTLKLNLSFYFLLPTLAILSLLVMFGLNISKFRLSESETNLVLDEIFSKAYANIPFIKRVQAVTVYASVFFVASIAMLISSKVTDLRITSFFVIALFTPFYAVMPINKVFFSKYLKYVVSMSIGVIWVLAGILSIEVFSIPDTPSLQATMVSFTLILVLSVSAKYLALKTTGVRLPTL